MLSHIYTHLCTWCHGYNLASFVAIVFRKAALAISEGPAEARVLSFSKH